MQAQARQRGHQHLHEQLLSSRTDTTERRGQACASPLRHAGEGRRGLCFPTFPSRDPLDDVTLQKGRRDHCFPTLSFISRDPLDDVHARVGVHDPAHFPHAQSEGGVLEWPLHLAPREEPQVAALGCRGAVGLGTGQVLERHLGVDYRTYGW